METILDIDATLIRALREEAARRGCSVSELVEATLRGHLAPAPEADSLPPLPVFSSGGATVDVADREALYRVMGEH